MVYENFLQTLSETLQHHFGRDYTILIEKIPKNNGITLDGLCITSNKENITPTIYLNSYYEQFQQGLPLSDIIFDIVQIYHSPHHLSFFDHYQITDIDQIYDKIAFKLIHTNSNENLLAELPHLLYLDLAIVFYLFLEETDFGQLTTLIYKKHQEIWNTSTETLYQLASHNTPLLFPPIIKPMNEVMKEIIENQLGQNYPSDIIEAMLKENESSSQLYVLTNQYSIYGASCLLYHHVLKKFSDSTMSDLIILPSSIHEVLLIPHEEGLCYQELREMVSEINQSEVPLEDQLSDQVYLYTRIDNCIRIASSYDHPTIMLPS